MPWLDVRNWGSTPQERQMAFACDRYLPAHDDALFRAVSVAAPMPRIFRWLCQLRVAPYSYDWIDNAGRRSPPRLIAGLEDLCVGQRFMRIFDLVAFETPRHLTLRTRPSRLFGQYAVTYMVVPDGDRGCRLVVKLLAAWPPILLLSTTLRHLGPLGDFIMMRKQLLTLRHLAERDARAAAR
jgi:hypothetical protein